MIVRPPKRIKKTQMGILLRDGRVMGEWGITSIEDAPKLSTIYAHSHRDCFDLVRDGIGRARYWKKRYVAYEFDGRAIYSARDVMATLEPEEALQTLRDWRDWAEEFGANVTSLTGTTRSIWRASLPASLLIVSGRFPVPAENFHIGGRQEARPDVYEKGTLWDIRSAYTATMKELWVGARYRRYTDRKMPSEGVGFARATVHVRRGTPWGLIPDRSERGTMVFPSFGTVEGWFDLQELRTAKNLGARVRIDEAWIARGIRLPWNRWAKMMESGYELPGKVPRLIKVMANSLWGTFAVTGRGAWVYYERGRPVTVLDEREVTAPCRALSAHIAAHMRSRLLSEVLHFNGDAVIAAHTDGVLLSERGHPVLRVGTEPGEWSIKDHAKNMVVLSPTAYSYEDHDGRTRYVLAGTPPQFREKVFRAMLGKERTGQSKLVQRRVGFS
jgi:hypothetical protein